jgi:flagellar biosynthetic protein FliR
VISISSTALNAWIAALLWPTVRILALLSVAPLFGHASIPARVKIGLSLLLANLIALSVPAPPAVALLSYASLSLLLQQILIGLAIGLVMRIVFAAVELAGELMALTMGLSFATFFDPLNHGQASAVSQLFGWLCLMVLVSANLHLLLLVALTESFTTLPIAADALNLGTGSASFRALVLWSGIIFSTGLQLALPVVAALLVTNIALGILTRAAPQLNLFGIGFPVTLGVGFLMIQLTLPYLATPLTLALSQGIRFTHTLMVR